MATSTRNTALALAAAAALVLAGCSTADPEPAPEETTAAVETTEAPEVVAEEAPQGTVVSVIEQEFSITLDREAFEAGTYTFQVENHGGASHSLVIEGDGIETASSVLINSGEMDQVIVDLPAGTYELWCSVGQHRGAGMSLTITVS